MNEQLTLSPAGAQFIKGFETLRLQTYDDATGKPLPAGSRAIGVPTIGWGHTGPDAFPGRLISLAQAEQFFQQDVRGPIDAARRAVRVPLTQPQFDALVSIIFNCGTGAAGKGSGIIVLKSGRPSTLLSKLNAGDYAGAADEFLKWDIDNGHEVAGLKNRRYAERAMFLSKGEHS